ncbi:hypothetical protein HYV82_01430 [Candidatus Woesearchaeota archaeon]|nr:hypothetical protein [Candidatus Woesearchaeota archaeon]
MKLSLNFEYLFLAVFIAVFLATGLGVYEQKLSHPYPVGYFASDSFFHQAEATWMKEQGTIKYALPNIEGGRKDVYDSHPPLVFEAVGVLSYASGLEVYDAIYLFAIIMLLLLGLLIYIIIRRFNKNVAVLSLPVTLLIYTPPFSQAILFGQWLFIAGALFMAACFWATSRLEEKHAFALLAIFMAAAALAHQPELLFAALFLAIYLAVRWIKTRHAVKEFVPALIAGLTAFALSAYSLNIFRLTWLMTYLEDAKLGLTQGTGVAEKGFSDVTLQSMGIGFQINILTLIGLLVTAGLIISVLLITTKKKTGIWAAWIAFFILGISYLTFLGLAKRAFAHRWLWHFYFAFFFGLAAYYGLKAVIKKWNITHSVAAAAILLILLAMPSYGNTHGSLMDQNNWEAMKWAADNLPESASVHVFDLGRMQQSSALYNMKRTSYIIHRNAYQKAFEAQGEIRGLEDIKIVDTYEFGLASAYSHLLCDRRSFDYGYYHTYLPSTDPECHDEFKEPTSPPRETKLSSMEYLYINTADNGNTAIYNNALAQKLIKKEWIRSVYSNPSVTILKNSRPGDECL